MLEALALRSIPRWSMWPRSRTTVAAPSFRTRRVWTNFSWRRQSHDMDAFLWSGFVSVLSARHCKRAYLDRPVRRDLLERVLRAAAAAPSTRNGQPWQVAVVSGDRRDALAKRLQAEFDGGVEQRPDYPNRPVHLDEAIEARARAAS